MTAEPFARFRMARTSDFDEAHQAMQSTFRPMRMRLLQPLRPQGVALTLNATCVGGVTVSYVRVGHDLQIDTVEAENYHVNVPLTGETDSRSGLLERVRSTPHRAAMFMPELPADIAWRAGCAQFCLIFPRQLLQQELATMLDRPLPGPIAFTPAMDVTSPSGRAWVDAVRLIERQASYEHSLLDHPLAAGHLERLLIEGLLLAQPHNYTEALAQPRLPAAPPAVRQAIDLMHGRPEHPWTTATLARRVAVSPRSLQDGFARSVGVPPMRYLRDVRLQRAHMDLRAADPGTATVAQVAGRWGFLYPSRFAAAYREKFEETPAHTLRHA